MYCSIAILLLFFFIYILSGLYFVDKCRPVVLRIIRVQSEERNIQNVLDERKRSGFLCRCECECPPSVDSGIIPSE